MRLLAGRMANGIGNPDKVQWSDAATGLPCLAVRHTELGNWCGYVGVAQDHPLHGKGYADADVDVYGGLTFAGQCGPEEDEGRGICHVPAPDELDVVHWFGFDCAHAWDVVPGMLKFGIPYLSECRYRTLSFVQGECKNLAAQLAALAKS